MLGLLINGLIWGAATISEGIENAQAMSKPSYYLDDGTPVYRDRKCQEYINGEKVVPKITKNVYGELNIQSVGERTGRVYFDPYLAELKREEKYDLEYLEESRKSGELAYLKYHPVYKRRATTEISTGKVIACLYEDRVLNEYRKFYLTGTPSNLYNTAPGDLGIVITKEEYDKLNIMFGSHRKIPEYKTLEELERLSKIKLKQRNMLSKEEAERRINKRIEEEKSETIWFY